MTSQLTPYKGRRRAPARRKAPARVPLPDGSRSSGFHIQAARGSGKSSLMASIAHFDFVRGVPGVLFEVQGGLVERFLWQFMHLGDEAKRELVERIVYIDMSGRQGYVSGWPLLYRLPGDSLYQIAHRFVDLIKKLDPDLVRAPILGANAMEYIAVYVGMALYAMGCQLTEAIDLLTHTERWAARLRQAARDYPEVEPAVSFLLHEYPNLSKTERHGLVLSLRAKLSPFTLDPTLKAMFGASRPSIDWDEVVREGKLVILDFQDIGSDQDAEIRFKMRWCFSSLWAYITRRQHAREKPLAVMIDEFNYLLTLKGGDDDPLISDLDNFINKDMRYRNVWLTVAHQEMFQLPDQLKKTLMSMGTQVLGPTSDRDSAETLGRNYFRYDPYKVKKEVEHKAVVSTATPLLRGDPIPHEIITLNTDTVEFTVEEQLEMKTQEFLDVNKFNFRLAQGGEGQVSRNLRQVSIRKLMSLLPYPDQRLVGEARQKLIRHCGTPIEQVTRELAERMVKAPADTPSPMRAQPMAEQLPGNLRFSKVPRRPSKAKP